MKSKLAAFFIGDIVFTIGQITTNFWSELGHFGVKVVATLILGIAGGVAGLVGKDLLYPWLLRRFTKQKIKNND